MAQKDSYIESAYEHLQVISQDREKRLEYEARQKAIRDYNQMMRENAEEKQVKNGQKNVSISYNLYLLREKRFEYLERATSDREFQRQLMEQYRILKVV